MTLPDLSWRAAAVAASLLIHFYILYEWSERPLIAIKASEQPPNRLFVQLNFPQPKPNQLMPVAEPPPKAPEKPPEPPPKAKPKPKPVAKPKPTPKPSLNEPPEPEQVVARPPESSPRPPPAASRRLSDLRNEYLSKLLAKIEKNKFYPTIARRRNLQGTIQVRFRLGCHGEVEALEIDGKHSLLRKAAGKAIEAAHPLPEIPAEIECPMLVDYAMAYTLDN